MFASGLHRFEQIMELTAASLDEARVLGRVSSEKLKALVLAHFSSARGYQVKTSVVKGDFTGTVRGSNFEASIRATVGQNSQYGTGGAPRDFFSLSLNAEARIPSIVNADRAGEGIADIATWVGVGGGGLGLGLLMWLMALLTGWIVISVWMVLGALALGGAAGAGIGRAVGNWVAGRGVSKADGDVKVAAAVNDWNAFREEALATFKNAAAGS